MNRSSRHAILCALLCLALVAGQAVSCSDASKPYAPEFTGDDRLFLRRSPASDIVFDEAAGSGFVSSELIATARKGVTRTMVEDYAKKRGVAIAGYDSYLLKYQLLLPVRRTRQELEELIADYEDGVLFEKVRPNMAFMITSDGWRTGDYDPDDAEWRFRWPADPGAPNGGIDAIRAREMWDVGGLGDKTAAQVNVGVLDSQFFTGHEDLLFAETFNNIFRPEAGSHGTHVSGTLAAVFNNGKGVSGVAPVARLYAASGASGLERNEDEGQVWTSFGMTSALSWLIAARECRVVNFGCNWPCAGNEGKEVREEVSRALKEYLALGYDFVIVTPAGNGTEGDGVPVDAQAGSALAAITSPSVKSRIIVVAVAGAEAGDGGKPGASLAGYSNSGDRVDIAAPGTAVQSTVYVSSRRDGYGVMSGTSMAAAHAAGVAACLFSLHPRITGDAVKKIICASAGGVTLDDPLGSRKKTIGMLNGYAAAKTAPDQNAEALFL